VERGKKSLHRGSVDRRRRQSRGLFGQGTGGATARCNPGQHNPRCPLQRETKAIPIVFVAVADPVGSGLFESVAHPGGNITGFLNMEGTLSEKCLELLKEIAPRSVRVALMFNPQTAPYAEYYLRPLQAVAPKLRVATFATLVRSADDIEAVFCENVAGWGRRSHPDERQLHLYPSQTDH
jgi:hypothetical protein